MAKFVEFTDTEGRDIAVNAAMIQHIRYHSYNVTEIKLNNGDCYKARMPYERLLTLLTRHTGGTEQG